MDINAITAMLGNLFGAPKAPAAGFAAAMTEAGAPPGAPPPVAAPAEGEVKPNGPNAQAKEPDSPTAQIEALLSMLAGGAAPQPTLAAINSIQRAFPETMKSEAAAAVAPTSPEAQTPQSPNPFINRVPFAPTPVGSTNVIFTQPGATAEATSSPGLTTVAVLNPKALAGLLDTAFPTKANFGLGQEPEAADPQRFQPLASVPNPATTVAPSGAWNSTWTLDRTGQGHPAQAEPAPQLAPVFVAPATEPAAMAAAPNGQIEARLEQASASTAQLQPEPVAIQPGVSENVKPTPTQPQGGGASNNGTPTKSAPKGPMPAVLKTDDPAVGPAPTPAGPVPAKPAPTFTEPAVKPGEVPLVVRQVADRMQLLAAAKPKDGVTIQLQPEHLGTVSMTVKSLSGGGVDAQISASNDSVRTALEHNRPMLAQAMDQRGLRLDNVTIAPQTQSSMQQSQAGNRQAPASQQQQPARTFTSDATTAELADSRATVRKATGVDLWI